MIGTGIAPAIRTDEDPYLCGKLLSAEEYRANAEATWANRAATSVRYLGHAGFIITAISRIEIERTTRTGDDDA